MITGASAHTAELTMDRRGPGPIRAPRKHSAVTVVCIGAFIAWCALPAVIWGARVGLSALSDHHPAEPERLLSFCVAPDPETRLALIGDQAHGPDSRHRAALLGR